MAVAMLCDDRSSSFYPERTMAFAFKTDQKIALLSFMERRGMKESAIDLLGIAKKKADKKRGAVTQNQSAPYEQILDDIEKAISNEWITADDFLSLLDTSEVAGRQHICVFTIDSKFAKSVLQQLSKPDHLSDALPELEDFWTVPTAPRAIIVSSSSSHILLKLVGQRRVWRREVDMDRSSEDEEWIHKWVVPVRAATVVKYSTASGLLQIRIPVRDESSQSETGKSVFEFVQYAMRKHYDIDDKKSWFQKLELFSITDSYSKVLDNFDDFVLRYDSPESDTAKSKLSKKGAIAELKDLRKDKMWTFKQTGDYSRQALRGVWLIDERIIFAHFNLDNGKRADGSTMNYARVFIPRQAKDAEIDHVLKRIVDHF